MCLVHILASVYLFITPKPDLNTMFIVFIACNISVAYVDTLANGLTAIVTKNNERIKALESIGKKKEEGGDTSMKSFGSFANIRTLFRALTKFAGGLLASRVSIHFSAVVMGVYPALMLLFTLFIFKEEKVIKILLKIIRKINSSMDFGNFLKALWKQSKL